MDQIQFKDHSSILSILKKCQNIVNNSNSRTFPLNFENMRIHEFSDKCDSLCRVIQQGFF
jgi:hypothetical protein